jgi:hypothetical protein
MDEWVIMRKCYPFIVLLSLVGCSTPFNDTSGPDAGANTEADAEPAAPTVISPPPPDAELNENYGIFVSLDGTPNGDGTRASPLSSIQTAIAKATPPGKHVYVCKGTYKEALTLQNGISVIGGYDCTSHWAIDKDGRSRLESPTSPAIRASDITVATSFMGFDVAAPDVTGEVQGSTASSIGLITQNASRLTIANGSITAGKGADGKAGTTPADPVNGPDVNGKQGAGSCGGNSNVGNLNPMTTCPTTAMAKGGTSACGGETGGDGALGPTSNFFISSCELTAPQKSGNGTVGQKGTDGKIADSTGAFNANGYVPADGNPGTNGSHGGGGSGGESAACTTCSSVGCYSQASSGSGGGAGGCGGLAGTPGKGGGASIAALLSASEGLTFDATMLNAAAGGASGKGSLGSNPTAGGAAGTTLAGAGAAQPGGAGGRPGISGSGAGGPSIGIAYTGGKPNLINDTVIKPGKPGAGVPEDSKAFQNVTWKLPASAAGIAQNMYSF